MIANPLIAMKAASLTTRLIVYGVLLALIAGLLWWAVGAPRVALSSARSDLATLQATHDGLMTKLAEAEAANKVKSEEVRAAYDAGVKSAATMREKETTDAYKRGVETGKRITAGTQRVRVEWRDRCPASAEGAGSEPDGGLAEVSGDRADLIGYLFGAGGGWEAAYKEAYRRLETAQGPLDACYEKPHVER